MAAMPPVGAFGGVKIAVIYATKVQGRSSRGVAPMPGFAQGDGERETDRERARGASAPCRSVGVGSLYPAVAAVGSICPRKASLYRDKFIAGIRRRALPGELQLASLT